MDRQSARRSLIYQTNFSLGICEQLRFIYDVVYELPDKEVKEKLTDLLADALVMAKKMQDRLVYYKKTYNDTTGHNGANIVRLTHNSGRVKMRRAR